MDNPKLMRAVALINQANCELMDSFEHGGLDEYDYEDSISLASELILEAKEFILDFYDETKGA